MTLARTWSVGLVGVRGALVEVELDIAQGLPGVALVGVDRRTRPPGSC